MLDQWTVIRKEVRGDMNRLCMPDLTVLQAVFLGVDRCQEAKLRADAEVRYDDVKRLIEELVLRNLGRQVAPECLVRR